MDENEIQEQPPSAAEAAAPAEAPSIPAELAGLTLEGWADKYARLLAEFDNYRRRTREDAAKQAESRKSAFILDLLGVVDSFELALKAAAESGDSFAEGMRAIDRQMRDLLASHGVRPIEALGEPFDPNLHDAIGITENSEVPPGAVAAVMQAGWRRGDEVLRHARVFVNKE